MGLKDLFWKNPEADKQPDKKAKSDVSPRITPQNIGATHATPIMDAPVHGIKKQEILDYFMKVFSDNNIQGPDYQEFRTALDGMKSQPMDEATKIKTLSISFGAMGLTPQKLVETANQYKKLFASKLDAYGAELKKQYEIQVESKQKEIDVLSNANKVIDEEMIKLNDKKMKNEAAIKELTQKMQTSISELNTNKNDWQATYDELITEIDGHIDLFNKHLLNQ